MTASYEEFARVYDSVMDEELYDLWFDFSQRHFPAKTQNIMELACGTGILSIRFSQAGYEVTGVDLSEEMLTIADQRARQMGEKITFAAGDMRELSGTTTFDVVTCYSDSLCYMSNASEVQRVFDGVYNSLNADGVFIFDVHSTYQVDSVFPGYAYHENDEDFAFLWDSFEGDDPHSVVHELTFFVKDSDGKFVRKDEVHQERTYPIKEYLTGLQKFSKVEVYADFEDKKPEEESLRWFFVCKK
ncbi:class I SAM-dependent methyltransferase [Lactococcus garvieae subsp. garvieae]|uniref:SAM-dependent methyltransferase n=1 Tax=Lactococcus garvieae TaxID=1363 RepID=A0A6L2ZWG7_9LACT|nr:class I SAM-dependent methyltransferase [Lactococcus garvieae]KAA8710173.1 class I SAM-dependent methyltransferase [Lactococcus garvieae subsp. garvieae]MDG6191719.1 class I SAM-dependent methyltransferase [Lactococcus garvieae]PCS02135.1 SAM-dependent methyltransferase [Lactococcus garvieae]QPR49366.1 class I SAM-dependent methyltransferase [Lactococcus garvieae]GFO52439.1 SAM-dependent methyltransferase [Lactococcus garvieae]